MKKYYSTIITILFFGLFSCSNEETKTQTPEAARPTVPILDRTVSDIDGNSYRLVTIGSQTWTKSNLNVSRYRNGDLIPQVQDPAAWAALTTGAWCYYENNTANDTVYSKLYNWYAVNDPRGLAPTGYHIPTDIEWSSLVNFLDPTTNGSININVSGNKMKATTGWTPYSGITNTNSSGFTGLPGGLRGMNGSFYNVGYGGYWWSSSEAGSASAWTRGLSSSNSYASRFFNYKKYGFSLRCVRD
jgi:uncharacterized protein (TIGR02145 family)